MKTLWLDKELSYDGSQLRSLFAYLDHGVLGNSVVGFVGACDIPFSHMIDGEDVREQSPIRGQKMVHFIAEFFDTNLLGAVFAQRLLASIVKDSIATKGVDGLTRQGDDIFIQDGKLSISIASCGPTSCMLHFAVNVTNEGTPVKTASLFDVGMKTKDEVKGWGQEILNAFSWEYQNSLDATRKVRSL